MAAFPSTPDEARHIEQEGGVRHSEGATKTVTRRPFASGSALHRNSHDGQRALRLR
jgi:hypothetical protein